MVDVLATRDDFFVGLGHHHVLLVDGAIVVDSGTVVDGHAIHNDHVVGIELPRYCLLVHVRLQLLLLASHHVVVAQRPTITSGET